MKVKNNALIHLLFVLLFIISYSLPQLKAQDANKTDDVSIAKNLGIYVFPAKNQTADQQSQDEFACYKWAVGQSGYDPMNPTKVEAKPVDMGPDGSAIGGAARGAAAGAAIGAIAGDAGKGAAIGAVGGVFRGRRRGRMKKSYEQAESQQAAADQTQALVDGFKKAFSVCMEGKDYTVSK
ncbi:MAG: hypothetical protein GQ561_03155 [Calditrichae bacterium]|nr:hypothetical protein [Calditrichia bacterium]